MELQWNDNGKVFKTLLMKLDKQIVAMTMLERPDATLQVTCVAGGVVSAREQKKPNIFIVTQTKLPIASS